MEVNKPSNQPKTIACNTIIPPESAMCFKPYSWALVVGCLYSPGFRHTGFSETQKTGGPRREAEPLIRKPAPHTRLVIFCVTAPGVWISGCGSQGWFHRADEAFELAHPA